MAFLIGILFVALVWLLLVVSARNTTISELKVRMKEREVAILMHCQRIRTLCMDDEEYRYWLKLQAEAHPHPLFELIPINELRQMVDTQGYYLSDKAIKLIQERKVNADHVVDSIY